MEKELSERDSQWAYQRGLLRPEMLAYRGLFGGSFLGLCWSLGREETQTLNGVPVKYENTIARSLSPPLDMRKTLTCQPGSKTEIWQGRPR